MQVQAAIIASQLRGLQADVLTQLLAGARRSTVAAGQTLHRVGDADGHVELDAKNAARPAGPGEHHGRGRQTARLVEADRPLRCGRATNTSPVHHRRDRQL
jgi:hypothetical protein